MASLITKSTLYDMLSMILPGYLLVVWGIHCFFNDLPLNYNSATVIVVMFIASYLVGIALHILAKMVFNPFLRNKPSRLLKEYNKLRRDDEMSINEKNDIVDTYYMAYTRVVMHYPNTAVPVLEAQVSFIRSIVCVAVFYIFTGCTWTRLIGISTQMFIGSLILAEILLVFMMFFLQNQIYFRVWEDEYYSTKVKREENSMKVKREENEKTD